MVEYYLITNNKGIKKRIWWDYYFEDCSSNFGSKNEQMRLTSKNPQRNKPISFPPWRLVISPLHFSRSVHPPTCGVAMTRVSLGTDVRNHSMNDLPMTISGFRNRKRSQSYQLKSHSLPCLFRRIQCQTNRCWWYRRIAQHGGEITLSAW